ncbi:MAG TPA: T9SS type A sorting domain-containing protein, partial [Flavisolibacter sp.]
NGNNLFAGSASGGMWKSTNGGSSWSPVTTNLPVLGVSTILIHPTDPQIIYAGTGEVYRVDSTSGTPNPSTTGFNVWKTRGTYGIGIIKSTDGGTTWSRIYSKSTSQMFGVQQLRFDPANSNTVYACATDGLYRSTDAGATWSQLFPLTMCTDVAINGVNIMVAGGNLGNTRKGIWRSTNDGVSFAKLTVAPLPATQQGFTKLAQLASAPGTVVASINRGNGAGNEIFRTTNFGTSWTECASTSHSQWQYWFANAVAINPGNPNKIVHAGVNANQFTVGGTNAAMGTSMHDDIHYMAYDPSNSNNLYVCTDGGIYKSTNANAGTPTFTAINNGLIATQFYASFGVSRTDPNFFIGGLQDNGVVKYDGGTWSVASWVGGDGAACAVDPNNDNNMMASRDARGLYRSTTGGSTGSSVANYWGSVADSRTAFVAPIAYAPSSSTTVYCATDNLHKSTNGGGTWSFNAYGTANNYIEAYRKTSIALAVSETDANKIYVSTSPFSQYDNDVDNIYVNGVPNVLKSTTGNTPFTIIKGSGGTALPDRYVMDFAISKTNDDSVFVALGGFGTSHVYVTGDGGATWANVGAGLPDVPFNAIMIDPVNPKVIYAGGDLGVYVSPNRGITWYDFNNGLTDVTLVFDLQYTADFEILAVTHGKGIYRSARYTSILPVDILSFTGEAQNTSNKLQWKVGNEQNLSHYELERSSNGNSFNKIGSVNATGASTYHYNDVLSNLQSYYYRLRSVDLDGTSRYSGVVHIKRNSLASMQVLGNPFHNSIEMKITLPQNGKGQVELFDAAGKLVKKKDQNFLSGQSVYSVGNLDHLPAGTYFLEVTIGQQRWKQKLLKK